ncbi:hypothetical protein ACEQ8H_002265 [Pleosporales sp. CAS-2024a]
MISVCFLALLLGSIPNVAATKAQQRSNGVATVNLSQPLGAAEALASGWIYGFPDHGTEADFSIAPHLIEQVAFGASRAGGDGGNWTLTDAFFNRLANDIRQNNMLPGLVLDLWNEADGSNFWDRPWEQYLAYWQRAQRFFRRKTK